MIDNNYATELNEYFAAKLLSYCEENEIPEEEMDDAFYEDEFKTQIEGDLEDKGFTPEEAQAVAHETGVNEATVYKLLAYFYLLCDDYDTVEELKTVIPDSFSKLEEFTDTELAKIVDARKLVDY